ncbi:MAG TPA: molybdenum cofactor guanylyltransferase [Thermoanaerobaculia bacterium]|nr:molybdenum cofactor guanylyltransferase [Thermoanaerobaculia bacterium]
MRFTMPAAVLAGGASRRMGVPKAALPYGGSTLLAHQTGRLADLFFEVFAVVKESPAFDAGPARIVLDGASDFAAIHGLVAALECVDDRVFVLAVDLPLVTPAVIGEILRRGEITGATALVPRADAELQPLAAVWRRRAAAVARTRIARGDLSLHGLAEEVGIEILEPEEWLLFDPSGNSFANVNTAADYVATRERA